MSRDITILTVDDSDALRYTLTRTLRREGYTVIEARNGAEALELASKSPDLITLDLNLPDIDGFEVCRRLRADPQTAHIPILHISATFVEPQHRVRGLEGGADAFLAEPISGGELVATIGALLRMKQAEREARLQAAEAEKAKEELRRAHDELDKRVHERTAELAQKNNEIRELTGRLLRSQDDERRRIARELHDSTGQVLSLLNINLSQLMKRIPGRNPGLKQSVEICSSLASEMTSQLRTVSYLLHPPLLDEIGLKAALKWFVDGFEQRSQISVMVDISDDFGRFPQGLEIALFRIVQEALTNIHRHSGSKRAAIRVSCNEHELSMEIEDEGRGISADRLVEIQSYGSGVGIAGMRERIRPFRGVLDIQSNDSGTKITVTLPVSRVAASQPQDATQVKTQIAG